MLLHELVDNVYVACEHKDTYNFEDYSNGCVVCKKCGYVKDYLVHTYYNAASSQRSTFVAGQPKVHEKCQDAPDSFWRGVGYPRFVEAVNLIRDICDKYNISYEVAVTASRLLVPVAAQLKPSSLRYFCAFYFLKAAEKCDVTRTYKEIAKMFMIPHKSFTTCLSKSGQNEIDVSLPSEALPRISFSPPLPFKHLKKIGKFADKFFEKTNSAPSSVLAFSIYHFHKKMSRKDKSISKMPIVAVEALTGVCSTSLKRLNKKYKGIRAEKKRKREERKRKRKIKKKAHISTKACNLK